MAKLGTRLLPALALVLAGGVAGGLAAQDALEAGLDLPVATAGGGAAAR